MNDKRTRNLGDIRIMRRENRGLSDQWFVIETEAFKDSAAARRAIKATEKPGTYRVVRLVGPPVTLTQRMNPSWELDEADDVAELHDASDLSDAGEGEAMP